MAKKRINSQKPKQGKRLILHESSNTPPESQYLVLSLLYLDSNYCLTKCNQEEKSSFAERIRILTQKKWAELKQLNRHKQGCEFIDQSVIRRPIPLHLTDDVKIIAFRFYNKASMVGYRNGNVFYVIWFDRCFDLYPH